jgi:hypothetical protein
VAELLDSMESENEKDEVLQEDNFKKYDEDDEFYLEQPEGLGDIGLFKFKSSVDLKFLFTVLNSLSLLNR